VQQVLAEGRPFAGFARPAIVKGTAGAFIVRHGCPLAVAGFTVADDRIVAIDLVVDPEKLRGLRP
jgi:RNA polymerase sigma-70 factor (ECF subfamily)